MYTAEMQSIEQQRLLHNREHLCNIYTTTIGPRSPSYFAYRRDAIDRTTEARLDPENMLNKMKYSDTSFRKTCYHNKKTPFPCLGESGSQGGHIYKCVSRHKSPGPFSSSAFTKSIVHCRITCRPVNKSQYIVS